VTTRAARKPTFHRFSELTRETVNRDFQVHTDWTDGEASVAEVIRRACNVGLAEIAFTEHARAGSSYYTDFFREVDNADAATPDLEIYRGFEVKVLGADGALDMSPAMRDAADIVLGSVHSFPLPDGTVAPAARFDTNAAFEMEFNLAKAIIDGGNADVLSHAGGMCLRTFGAFPMEYMEELVAHAARGNVAFEINTSYHGDIIDTLLTMLARHDPPVSVGSDAHRLDEIGTCRDLLRARLPA